MSFLPVAAICQHVCPSLLGRDGLGIRHTDSFQKAQRRVSSHGVVLLIAWTMPTSPQRTHIETKEDPVTVENHSPAITQPDCFPEIQTVIDVELSRPFSGVS